MLNENQVTALVSVIFNNRKAGGDSAAVAAAVAELNAGGVDNQACIMALGRVCQYKDKANLMSNARAIALRVGAGDTRAPRDLVLTSRRGHEGRKDLPVEESAVRLGIAAHLGRRAQVAAVATFRREDAGQALQAQILQDLATQVEVEVVQEVEAAPAPRKGRRSK